VTDQEIEAINAKASTLMHLGMTLLDERRPGAAVDALECFDRALDVRREVPLDGRPFQVYLLAACWLNRADALMQMQDAARIPAALHSYDQGIAVLQALPIHSNDDPRYARRLAVGYQNRGLALLAHTPADAAPALQAFADGLAVLDGGTAAALSDRDYLLAGIWTNIAIARLRAHQPDDDAQASVAALRAVGLVAAQESTDVEAAEVGLKARHALCQALAGHVAVAGHEMVVMPDALHEAVDAAEAGLRLARQWDEQGEPRFWALAHSLYAFGRAVYMQFQPQFLDEFEREHARFR
jgi:hypothetical protein